MSVLDQPAKASGSIGVVIVNWNSWGVLSLTSSAPILEWRKQGDDHHEYRFQAQPAHFAALIATALANSEKSAR